MRDMVRKIIDYLLEKWENRIRRNTKKKHDGIPVLQAIYKPHREPPNMLFHLHPDIGHDTYLVGMFSSIADYIRDEYGEILEKDKQDGAY